MTQQPTLVKFGGQPCVIMDADQYPQARGKANGYCCPLGRSPGIGYVLMLRSAWDQIKDSRNASKTFEVLAGDRIILPGMYIISAVKISGGRPNDPNSVYLVKFADKRWLAAKLSDVTKQINVLCPAPPADGTDESYCYADSLDSGSLYTWARAVEVIWNAMPILGAFPGLPNAPDGYPNNFQFLGVNAWDALHVLLDKLQCAVAYNPVAATFSIVQLGTTQAGLADALAGATRGYLDDAEPFDTTVADAPYTIRVYFNRLDLHYGSQKETTRASGSWATGPLHAVDTASGITGAAAGTVVQLWDDLPAVAAFDGSLVNGTAVNARAAERVARWKADRATSTPRLRTLYQGIVNTFRPGSQVKAIWWGDYGAGWLTEIRRHDGFVNLIDDAAGLRCEWSAENLAPPDLGRKTFPNFPQYLQVVTIAGESGGDPDGTEVEPVADGLFDASVTRLNPDGATDTSGCFSQSESCWVLVINRENGSASATPTLKKGDRYLARLCGSKSERPVYMIQKDEAAATEESQFSWVVVEASVTIDDGTPIAPFSLCLWSGKKLTIEPTAATFCEGDDRYSRTSNIWILSVDALNGSGSSAPLLYKGDRFLGKLVGTYDVSGDSRQLYAIRKGTQHDIVRVVGESSEAVTGGNVTPHVGGVWNGEVLSITVGATNFVGGATPYTSGPPCWILAPDLPGGSVDVTARLKHNDRHPAIYLGEFDNGEGARPLYAIRMTTHFGWIKFKLSYAIGNTSSSQAATVLEYWGTKTPADGPVTVWNLEKNTAGTYVFQGVANAVGYAVWDEKTAKYKIVVMESDGKEPAYGGLQVTGASVTGGSLQDATFTDQTEIVGMTRKTSTPHGLIADKAGDYLFTYTAIVADNSGAGGTTAVGVASAALYRSGSAMNHQPVSQAGIIVIGGTAIHATLAITHINSMAVGDYAHVKLFGTAGLVITAQFTAVYLGPTDGSVAAPSPSLPPSPSARVQSGSGGGEIPQQTLNHYYGG